MLRTPARLNGTLDFIHSAFSTDETTQMKPADAAYEVGRAIVSLLPIAGGPLQVLYENVFSSPLEKRKSAWLEMLAEAIWALEKRVDGLTPQALSHDSAFISAALQATQIAIRSHQKEKLEALRNAVISSATREEPDEDLQQIFLQLIDRLTPWHLRVLALLQDPESHLLDAGMDRLDLEFGGFPSLVTNSFPEIEDRTEFRDLVFRGLEAEGLLDPGAGRTQIIPGSFTSECPVSDLGRRFLRFISDPGRGV